MIFNPNKIENDLEKIQAYLLMRKCFIDDKNINFEIFFTF